jgi:hypothetical protein
MTIASGNSGSTITATPSVSFTMLELSDVADCSALRTYFIKKGLTDKSPKIGSRIIPSFNGKIAKDSGADFIARLQNIPADWLVLSGHHGVLYSADYATYGDPLNVTADLYKLRNNQQHSGFFNDNYHEGRWENASRGEPDKGQDPAELYCSTTEHAAAHIAPFDQSNPYIPLDAALRNSLKSKCKGIILSACNTLSYKYARIKWVRHFPDAVIFGTFARIPRGLYVIKSLMGAPSTTKDFWNAPRSVLDSSADMPKQIAGEVARLGRQREIKIGMIYNKKVYFPLDSGPEQVEERDYDFDFTE